jgi:hypothetical protein
MRKTPRLKAALADVEASRAEGWPEPLGPYDILVREEIEAPRLTHIGFITGVLLDIPAILERQRTAAVPPDVAAQRNRLHQARKIISQERMAAGELQQELLLRRDALEGLRTAAPHRVGAQIQELIDAAEAGWSIRYVPSQAVGVVLPDAYNMILSGDPGSPQVVYTEKLDGFQPHELSWGGPATPEWAGQVYGALSELAMSQEDTLGYLQLQLKAYG